MYQWVIHWLVLFNYQYTIHSWISLVGNFLVASSGFGWSGWSTRALVTEEIRAGGRKTSKSTLTTGNLKFSVKPVNTDETLRHAASTGSLTNTFPFTYLFIISPIWFFRVDSSISGGYLLSQLRINIHLQFCSLATGQVHRLVLSSLSCL